HNLPVYPDLRRKLVTTHPDEEWDSDITGLQLENGEKVYLHLTQDNYTHAVVGWKVASTLEMENTLEALEMAIQNRKKAKGSLEGLIHHSDRGTQYCSIAFTKRLKEEGIKISMTETGNPRDNPVAERLNNTIKNELFKGCVFKSVEEVETTLREKLNFYHNERPHMSNCPDMLTPMQAYQCVGKMKRNWKSYREEAIMACEAAQAGG
ncbi:MAG: IS3 family transposase, partial [Burkholderiales bacterium]|nr:IS3 family transposase [Burkholderiales bacterium]